MCQVDLVNQSRSRSTSKAAVDTLSPSTYALGYKDAKAKTNEILIDGHWYNIKNFRHPGGRVLLHYEGNDGTQAFREFHQRSKKAKSILKSLPKRKAEAEEFATTDPLVYDFCLLRDQLEKEGFFEPEPIHICYRLIEIFCMHIFGYYLFCSGGFFPKIVSIVILGIAQGRCGWLMHEAGHYSLTGFITLDRYLQVFFIGIGLGSSASFWRTHHNHHHAATNRLDLDPDLNTMPLVAYTRGIFTKVNGGLKWWIQHQAWLLLPVINPLVTLSWQFIMHPIHSFKTKQYAEIFAFLVRWAIIGKLLGVQGAFYGSALFLIYDWIAANYLFLNFAVSHTHLPKIPRGKTVDWVRFGANHTINIKPGPFGFVNWWMSFLNFQIEHHLFPTMPQFRHPEVGIRIRKLFEKHRLEYQCVGYWEAIRMVFANLNKVGKEVDTDMFYG